MNKFKIFSFSAVGFSALNFLIYDRKDSIKTYAKQKDNQKELVGVVLIGRHGARTPFKDNLIPAIEEVRHFRRNMFFPSYSAFPVTFLCNFEVVLIKI